jgi:hypothetical protein
MTVEPRAFSGVEREHVRTFECELFADLHDVHFFGPRRTRPPTLATNRKRLVEMPVHGKVTGSATVSAPAWAIGRALIPELDPAANVATMLSLL